MHGIDWRSQFEKAVCFQVYDIQKKGQKLWTKQNLPEVKVEGGMYKQNRFLGSETSLYATVSMDTCHYSFVSTYKIYSEL